jgi:3',5'-cyclic-AMP phosphodiesterase
MSDYIKKNLNKDGIDRRSFLKCMAWADTGSLCVLQGGVLKSFALSDVMRQKIGDLKGDLSFVQISDSHIGFNKAANTDVTATLREAIAKVFPPGSARGCFGSVVTDRAVTPASR